MHTNGQTLNTTSWSEVIYNYTRKNTLHAVNAQLAAMCIHCVVKKHPRHF